MDIFTNPSLKECTRVKLKDGREAVISDDKVSQKFRMMDVGTIKLQKIDTYEIDSFYALGTGWHKYQYK